MLSAHYRSPINFSAELLEQAKNGLERIYNCLDNLEYLKEHAQAEKITDSERELQNSSLGLRQNSLKPWTMTSIRRMPLQPFLIL